MKLFPALACVVALAGCANERPTGAQREAVAACRSEADRALSSRTRTDSLRNDERDARSGLAEFGSGTGTNRESDILGRERLIDDCLAGRGTDTAPR